MKYPNQVDKSKREKITLSVEPIFSVKGEEEDAPLEIFSDFSRYVFNISDAVKKTGVKANLSLDDYPLFKLRLETLLNEMIKKSFFSSVSSPEKKSPAYKVQIMRQGTASELILKTGSISYVMQLRESLQANLERYASNATQIEAIDDAVDLFNSGLLQECKNSESEGEVITVWTQQDKYFRTTKKFEETNAIYNLCYKFEIKYTIGYDLPFSVEITNYFAPLVKSKTSKLTEIKKSALREKVSYTHRISEGEMIHFLNEMERYNQDFRQLYFKKQYMLSYNQNLQAIQHIDTQVKN